MRCGSWVLGVALHWGAEPVVLTFHHHAKRARLALESCGLAWVKTPADAQRAALVLLHVIPLDPVASVFLGAVECRIGAGEQCLGAMVCAGYAGGTTQADGDDAGGVGHML